MGFGLVVSSEASFAIKNKFRDLCIKIRLVKGLKKEYTEKEKSSLSQFQPIRILPPIPPKILLSPSSPLNFTSPLSTSPHHHKTMKSIHHHTLLTRHPISDTNHHPPPSISSLFLKPSPTTTTLISSSTTTFSLSSTTSTTPSTSQPISFDQLHHHLSTQDFRQADEETRRLLIVLAGEAAEKRGYVFFSEVQFIQNQDLIAIDELWKKFSNNKFGYSIQKKIWKKAEKDFTKFFIKVGWMKKLDTEIEQYNYRAFPNEFIWELNDETPEGHLPLTNALRGTQLLNCVLNHPAFEEEDAEEEEKEFVRDGPARPLSKQIFKSDYSF